MTKEGNASLIVGSSGPMACLPQADLKLCIMEFQATLG